MTRIANSRIDAATFDRLVSAAGDDPRALAALASTALWSGNEDRAYGLARRALSLAPDDPQVKSATLRPISAGVPSWHFRMLRDTVRNDAFEGGVRRAVRPGMHVLDIGSGSGLLAMMAARAGAGSVVSCEVNEAVADAAREIVEQNGFAGTIRIVTKASLDLDADADMGGRADLIVSEIVSNDLLSEAVLPTMEDAVRRLLKPGGTVVPASGAAIVALAMWTGLDEVRVDDASGFDVSLFNRLRTIPYRLDIGDPRLSLSSEPADLFSFDFGSGGPWRGGRASAALTAAAPANGVVQWIRLQLDSEIAYENRPAAGADSCWAVLFTPFDPPRRVQAGETVRVEGSYEPSRLRVWVDP